MSSQGKGKVGAVGIGISDGDEKAPCRSPSTGSVIAQRTDAKLPRISSHPMTKDNRATKVGPDPGRCGDPSKRQLWLKD